MTAELFWVSIWPEILPYVYTTLPSGESKDVRSGYQMQNIYKSSIEKIVIFSVSI